jgi:MSHA biogenesis protein MshJ
MPNKIQERFESLTTREKVIVVTTLLVALWSCWDSIFYGPFKLKQKSLKQELVNLNSQIDSQRETATLLENSGNVDPDAENRSKLAELKNQYSRLQEQVMLGDKKFVPPKLMAKALSDMLKQNRQLTLIKLESLPPTTLLAAKQQHQPIYKHGLAITFTGSYSDTVNYLVALEALPWAIVWESLDYQVKDYPLAEITIRAFTLSFEKGWLGV